MGKEPPLERFIVGTGRCGSTLLSRMLAEHPGVLSLSELLNGLDVSRRFAPEPITGREFGALISAEQPFVTAVLRRGYRVPEIVYPFDTRGRYRRGDALPWILASLLPHLSDDPDALFDALLGFADTLPAQPAALHYRALFDWLGARLGRPYWIERSGSSIQYLGALIDAFPEARFLHLHRDGPEVALSMREHHGYRLPICFLYDAPLVSGRRVSELGGLDLCATPQPDDAVSQILASRPEAALFGRYWSDQVLRGLDALPERSPQHFETLAFEDLLASPESSLARIESFFELPPAAGWRARAAALVQGAPALRAPELPAPELAALQDACQPGLQRLGRV